MAPDELEGDDTLDHPDDLAGDADDDETAELRPLFPNGNPATAPEWQALADEGLLDDGA